MQTGCLKRFFRPGCLVLFTLSLSLVSGNAVAADTPTIAITLAHDMATLDGPWKFHVDDDPRWADAGFDDADWENVDLTAPPGTNDGDVGLPDYAPGWSAKGHPGYHGYAWYRIHLVVTPAAGEILALLGPWAVDSVYQVYVNGTLLGGVGDFTGPAPTAYGYHYPRFFALPPNVAGGGPLVIAIRVWMGPWVAAPSSGGIHIAPAIGGQDAITAQYRLQWLKIFEGYMVDAVPALLFVLMAIIVLSLLLFERTERAYLWMAVAILLSAVQRGNQALFFWWQIETVQDFVIFILALTVPLSLGAWMMAWRSWFKLEKPVWLPKAIAALTIALIVAQLLARPWLFHSAFPHSVATTAHYLIMWMRLAFLGVLALTVYQAIRSHGRGAVCALPAILAIAMVLFAAELSVMHVPGIWFPWGVGFSLSECMSLVFDVLLLGVLLWRLRSYVPPTVSGSSPGVEAMFEDRSPQAAHR
jgi:hypothetical protein